MKRLIVILLLVLAAGAWADGQKEQAQKLLFVNNGKGPWPEGYDTGGYASPQDKILGDFAKANPNIQVTLIMRDQATGSLITDALMAKGTPPDVWWDAAGYFPKYMVPEYALPMEKYVDTSIYQKDILDLYTFGGHVYALPAMNVTASLCINLDMLKAIGYTMPSQENWTTDEFLRLSEKLKAAGIPVTMIMTKDRLISWNMPWLYAFGAQLYKDFDHGKVAINSPQAKAGLEYMKLLVDKGYAYPHPNEQNDDAGVDLFTSGQVFSCMMQNGHVDGWVPEQMKQGKLAKPFEYDFVEFPHAPGLKHTPIAAYQSIAVAHKSDSEARNKAIAKLMLAVTGKEFQEYVSVAGGGFPTIAGFEAPAKGALGRTSTRNLMKLGATAGIMDLGGLEPKQREIDRSWTLPIQEFMDGKISAQEVLNRFEAEANKVIGAK